MNSLDVYHWLVEQVQTNQFFAGIAIPVVFSSCLYLCRSIPNKIYNWIKLVTTVEFTLTSKNDNYDEILRFLYEHRLKLFSRNYSISRNSKFLTPGYGISIGVYQGTVFVFKREIFEQKMDLQENTHITFFTRNLKFINHFFEQSTKKEKNDVISIFNQSSGHFNRLCEKPKRALDTVFINDNHKEEIIDKINWFLANEQWYVQRGISYKLCFLLYGLPGTGKSSLIYAIASHFGFDVRLINELTYFERIICDGGFNYVDDDGESRSDKLISSIYVVEDIDCLNMSKRDDIEEEQPPVDPGQLPELVKPIKINNSTPFSNVVLQRVLNALDGIATPHGKILFFTTNDLDNLDAALIRKGRVDVMINIDKIDSFQFINMFSSFYGQDWKFAAEQFVSGGYYRPKVGAQYSDLFLNNRPEKSLEILKVEISNDVSV